MNSTASPRTRLRQSLVAAMGVLALALAGCASTPSPVAPSERPTSSSESMETSSGGPSATPTQTSEPQPDAIVGTVLRFTSDRTSIDVTVQEDNPAVRDLLSRLPLDVAFEDLVGREKIAYLEPELDWAGSPGSDPEDGDLIYYTDWGNLGFYYNAEGVDYSDATIHIGTYDASLEQLTELEGDVTIEVVE